MLEVAEHNVRGGQIAKGSRRDPRATGRAQNVPAMFPGWSLYGEHSRDGVDTALTSNLLSATSLPLPLESDESQRRTYR